MTIRRNYDMNELKRLDLAHHLPAQADYQVIEDLGGSRIITHADGCVITDAEGKSLLDGMAGLWCVNVGYGRAELAEVARDQMLELPYYNTFFKTATPPPVLLAAKIAEKMQITNPALKHVFFNASGSESNDTVFRLVRHYWALKGQPERQVFISRHNAYHGSTVAGASLGGMSFMHAQGGLPIRGSSTSFSPMRLTKAWRGRRSLCHALRAIDRRADIKRRARKDRRLYRRAGPRGRGRDHPAQILLAKGRGHLPQIRYLAGDRRSDHWLWPFGLLVWSRILWD